MAKVNLAWLLRHINYGLDHLFFLTSEHCSPILAPSGAPNCPSSIGPDDDDSRATLVAVANARPRCPRPRLSFRVAMGSTANLTECFRCKAGRSRPAKAKPTCCNRVGRADIIDVQSRFSTEDARPVTSPAGVVTQRQDRLRSPFATMRSADAGISCTTRPDRQDRRYYPRFLQMCSHYLVEARWVRTNGPNAKIKSQRSMGKTVRRPRRSGCLAPRGRSLSLERECEREALTAYARGGGSPKGRDADAARFTTAPFPRSRTRPDRKPSDRR